MQRGERVKNEFSEIEGGGHVLQCLTAGDANRRDQHPSLTDGISEQGVCVGKVLPAAAAAVAATAAVNEHIHTDTHTHTHTLQPASTDDRPVVESSAPLQVCD